MGRRISSPTDAQEHLKKLKNRYGVSMTAVAEMSGFAENTVWSLYRGSSRYSATWEVYEDTVERILSIEPMAAIAYLEQHGRLITAEPTRRMVNALRLEGFGIPFLGEHYFHTNRRNMLDMLNPRKVTVYLRTHQTAKRAYAELEHKSPADFGISERYANRIIRGARNRDAVPRHCWDAETIMNPDAIPEWTGACGTPAGYRIHRREGHKFWRKDASHKDGGYWAVACPPCQSAYKREKRDA
jgi:hypothetical protein